MSNERPQYLLQLFQNTRIPRNIQQRQEWVQDRSDCWLYCLSFLLWHPTNWACDKTEMSTCQCKKWSLRDVRPMIIALHHSARHCQTWFPVYRELAWQKYILRTAAEAQNKKKMGISHISVLFMDSRRNFWLLMLRNLFQITLPL